MAFFLPAALTRTVAAAAAAAGGARVSSPLAHMPSTSTGSLLPLLAAARASRAGAAGPARASAWGVQSRSFFVRAHGSNVTRDFERLQSKLEASGLERTLKERKRYVKPHLVRQKKAKDAVFNRAKRERIRVVEELMLDRRLCPF
jgi:2'-5' RNA ligase